MNWIVNSEERKKKNYSESMIKKKKRSDLWYAILFQDKFYSRGNCKIRRNNQAEAFFQ